MRTVEDMGKRGVNTQGKSGDVLYGQPLIKLGRLCCMRGNCTGNWWRLPSDIRQRLRARMPIWPQKKAGGGLLENTIVRLGLGMKLGIWYLQ